MANLSVEQPRQCPTGRALFVNAFLAVNCPASAPWKRTSKQLKELHCETEKEQEVQSKGVAERRGLKQPSTRQLVRNASEHDSARQAGEPASQRRNQVRRERKQWHSQSTVKDGYLSLSGGWW